MSARFPDPIWIGTPVAAERYLHLSPATLESAIGLLNGTTTASALEK